MKSTLSCCGAAGLGGGRRDGLGRVLARHLVHRGRAAQAILQRQRRIVLGRPLVSGLDMRAEARQVEALGQRRDRALDFRRRCRCHYRRDDGRCRRRIGKGPDEGGLACSGMYPGLGSTVIAGASVSAGVRAAAVFSASYCHAHPRPRSGGVCGGAWQGRYRPAPGGRGRRHPRRASSRPSRSRRRSRAAARPERRPAPLRAGPAAPARPASRRSEPGSRRRSGRRQPARRWQREPEPDASAPRSFWPSSPCARQASLPGRPRADRRRSWVRRSARGRADSATIGAGVASTTGGGVSAIGSSATCANKGVEDKAMTAAIAVMAGRIFAFPVGHTKVNQGLAFTGALNDEPRHPGGRITEARSARSKISADLPPAHFLPPECQSCTDWSDLALRPLLPHDPGRTVAHRLDTRQARQLIASTYVLSGSVALLLYGRTLSWPRVVRRRAW